MLTKEQIIYPLRHDLLIVNPQTMEWFRFGDELNVDTFHLLNPGALLFYPAALEDILTIYQRWSKDAICGEMRRLSGLAMSNSVLLTPTPPWRALWRKIRQIPMTAGTTAGDIPQLSLNDKSLIKRRPRTRGVAPKLTPVTLGPRDKGVRRFVIIYKANRIQSADISYLDLPRRMRVILATLVRWVESHGRDETREMSREEVARLLIQPDGDREDWEYFMCKKELLKGKKLISYE